MPGYPHGKLAHVRCPHLTADIRCALFGRPERPSVCRDLQPQPEMCGNDTADAFAILADWEQLTAPAK